MKKLVTLMIALALLVSVLGMSAFAEEAKTVTIGISVRNIENPYYVQVKEGVEMFCDYIKERGDNVNFDIQFIACDASDEQQISDVQAIIARGGADTLIYIDPNNASVCASVARICEENGVYWCSVWSYADGVYPYDYQYYAFYQSPGEVEVESKLMLDMFANFDTPNEGKVVFIKGLEGNTASNHRYQGFCNAVEQCPGIEVLDVQNGDWNPQTAQNLTTTWLNKYGADNIDAIVCANDEMALAAIETLKAEGLNGKIKVTGFDGIPDAANAIAEGNMYGTVGANPYVEGGLGVAYLYACWRGDVDVTTLTNGQRSFLTEPQMVTPANVEAYINNTPTLDFENYMGMIQEEIDLTDYQ